MSEFMNRRAFLARMCASAVAAGLAPKIGLPERLAPKQMVITGVDFSKLNDHHHQLLYLFVNPPLVKLTKQLYPYAEVQEYCPLPMDKTLDKMNSLFEEHKEKEDNG